VRGMMFLRVRGPVPGHRVGDVVRVPTDEEGTPLELAWRRRLQDAKLDGCVEVVEDPENPRAVKSARPKNGAAAPVEKE